LGISLIALLTGCFRGQPSESPPIRVNPNMDEQPKLKPQSVSAMFKDGAGMRAPVDGTVARGHLNEDDAFYLGLDEIGKAISKSPLPIDMKSLKRGQERFNIYCAPCHGQVGDGQGIMIKYGYVPPPSFHIDRIRDLPDGEIFGVISNGIRNMPSYKLQVPVADRWAIVNYLRALQLSQNASINDVPQEMRDKVK